MTPAELAKSNSEHAHQRALFARINEYCNNAGYASVGMEQRLAIAAQLNLLFAIPNGGERHKAVAGKMKAEGAKSGVFDLFLPVPAPIPNPDNKITLCGLYYHGMFIEMKEPGRRNHANGGLSDNQRKFMNDMMQQGYYCVACYTWEEAFAALLRYLGG